VFDGIIPLFLKNHNIHSVMETHRINLKVKYVNFWAIPRRLVYICRRFETLCQVHLGLIPLKMDLKEGFETSANINQMPGNHPKVDILKRASLF
jgi:hypothetical protein